MRVTEIEKESPFQLTWGLCQDSQNMDEKTRRENENKESKYFS